jgi:hypothetical protein
MATVRVVQVRTTRRMRWMVGLAAAIATVALLLPTPSSVDAGDSAVPIVGIELPSGYRDWRLISIAHEEGDLNDLRAILGNTIAIDAYRNGTLPFPDGAIVARLAWRYVASEENNRVFGRPQSFVAGPPVNGVQFMVKDSKRFASTGGWGFAQFNEGMPASESVHQGCFHCHEPAKAHDFLFTRYAP